jgi:DNA-binding NarL/FixJ family response regulator
VARTFGKEAEAAVAETATVTPPTSPVRIGGRVSLLGGGEVAERVAMLLREHGLAVSRQASPAELLAEAEPPTTIVVCVAGTLAAAVKAVLVPLRRSAPEAELVVVCGEIRAGEIRRALAAGVVGVVLERQIRSALMPCVAAARAGQVCLARPYARQIEPAALSMRERQILGLVVTGHANSQIAERLFIAESTVKSHLSSAFAKLGVGSRHEAVDLLLDGDRGIGRTVLHTGSADPRWDG